MSGLRIGGVGVSDDESSAHWVAGYQEGLTAAADLIAKWDTAWALEVRTIPVPSTHRLAAVYLGYQAALAKAEAERDWHLGRSVLYRAGLLKYGEHSSHPPCQTRRLYPQACDCGLAELLSSASSTVGRADSEA